MSVRKISKAYLLIERLIRILEYTAIDGSVHSFTPTPDSQSSNSNPSSDSPPLRTYKDAKDVGAYTSKDPNLSTGIDKHDGTYVSDYDKGTHTPFTMTKPGGTPTDRSVLDKLYDKSSMKGMLNRGDTNRTTAGTQTL